MNQFLPIILIFFSTIVFSQKTPSIQFEDEYYTDVLIVDNITYYATINKIMRINSDNSTDEIFSFNSPYINGKFTKTKSGWVYLSWDNQLLDVIYPNMAIIQYNEIEIVSNYISFLNSTLSYGSIEEITFESKDKINVLLSKWGDYNMVTTDIEHNVSEMQELNLSNVRDMILLNDNSNLIITYYGIYNQTNSSNTHLKTFNEPIIDVEYFPFDNKILVLTESKIYYLDDNFTCVRIIEIPESNRVPKAISIHKDYLFLIELENNQSYISFFDQNDSLLSTFVETPGLKYTDIKIQEDIIAIWGNTNCNLSSNILKIDTNSVELEIPISNLAIDNLTLQYGGEIIDTILLTNGDTTYRNEDKFEWSLTVHNYSLSQVDSFSISSSRIGYGFSPISIDEKEPIPSNESRNYEGNFSFQNNGSGPYVQALNVFIGNKSLDTNCADNRVFLPFPTNVTETKNRKINIYPNPTSRLLNISVDSRYSYNIYDSFGFKIKNRDNTFQKSIDVSLMEKGLYFLEIIINDRRFINKFIKT